MGFGGDGIPSDVEGAVGLMGLDECDCEQCQHDALTEAFTTGIDTREHAAAIWSEFRLDESV
ncbi:hypothetical protein [Nocardia pseudobrasiliensis]|uniref:Uncharacterized protein n=1 Tax=Nocardia pseudobrasiliensis TaxID=45979 RepID=A0A370IG77_9NOCA|nr:hypothetical protein [Nocardia pseudobrasiliensis]RDI68464.1 hypothetical protein DFR76_102865 [Nocardia pseudobrasiliensis]